jgi:ketosteroid isomerase-like protein
MTITPAVRTVLETAKEFIRAVEAKDFDAVQATLSPDARQLFMHSGRTSSPTAPRVSVWRMSTAETRSWPTRRHCFENSPR